MGKEARNELVTPQDFFEDLNREYGFTLDAAASARNAKCPKFYTPEQDGLEKSWAGERVWCHPPGDDLALWVQKCYMEGQRQDTTVVLFVPAKTDAAYFHKYILGKSEMHFLQGRMVMEDENGRSAGRPACGQMLAIYRGPQSMNLKPRIVQILTEKGTLTAREILWELTRLGYQVQINSITSRMSQLHRQKRVVKAGWRQCGVSHSKATEWRAKKHDAD